ncbi:thymidylate synthase [Streptomyces sp. SBT349]|uniref:thymidylate synthase n=1 Tax=Streptomyces sp. SBT349 TaxID=1580539 RepID=UPI00066C7BF4|nr:thymidylate synthase [Streptomyces sp. SBT349]
MLTPPTFRTFEGAYLTVLEHVSSQFQYRNAPRGNTAHECVGMAFRISEPRERFPYMASRRVNPVFHFAEALWYLAGRSDLAMIAHYSPRMRTFSRDGATIASAYGARLFTPLPCSPVSQFDRVLRLLQDEQDTKRAVLQIFSPYELDVPANPDVSCVVALHLFAREGRLHMVCYMRANDANRGLIADIFSFTLIQEYAAVLLGLDLGSYTHHIGSMHINDRDMPQVKRILDEAATRPSAPIDGFPFPAMPTDTTAETIAAVLEHEEALRLNQVRYRPEDIATLDLPHYWQQAVLLFEVHRQLTHAPGGSITEAAVNALDPGLRWLVAHKWPARVPARVRPRR